MGPWSEVDRRTAVNLHPGSRRAVGVQRFSLAEIFFSTTKTFE